MAAPIPAPGSPSDTAPKATPTARPYGILCRVIARISKVLLGKLVFDPSESPTGSSRCKCGSILSIIIMNNPPKENPNATCAHDGTAVIVSCISAKSRAGTRSDQKLAAIITPAANPSIASRTFWFTLVVRKTDAAPSAVRNHVKDVAIRACNIGLRSAKL
jgi:hypothetical protein